MVSNKSEIYRQIDYLASFGLMTTYDIAGQLKITEAQVANYLAAKRGGDVVNRDADRTERELKEAQAVAGERRQKATALVDRAARLDKIRWYLERTAGRPEVYRTLRGHLVKYASGTANHVNTQARRLIAHYEERATERVILTWSQRDWAERALDLLQDEPIQNLAAITKRAHQLIQVRRKYSQEAAE